MRFEVVDRKLQHQLQLLQLKFVATEVRREKRTLVIVAKQMLVIGGAAGHRRGQQMLEKNNAGTEATAVGAVIAFSNAVETVARCDDPGVGGRAFQIFAEIFENGGMLRRERSEIVDRLIDARSEAGGRDVMSEDSAVHHLRKKRGLRDQLSHQMRNIFLPLRRKRLLIPRTPAEGDDNDLPFLRGNPGECDRVTD